MGDRRVPTLAAALLVLVASRAPGRADWPVFRHDASRSGGTDAVSGAPRLRRAWTHRSPVPPQPAWDATARQDAYHGIAWLPERRLYDAAFEPIVVGRAVFFGSSADDTLHAIDLDTGRTSWRRTVGGPIRVAPAFHDGRVFFGSDDGHAYCLDAATGEERWRFSAEEPTRLVLQDGRIVSPRACRTGVVVRETGPGTATAYFGQSLLPWDDSWLCAVDAATGLAAGPGRYTRRISREGHFDGPMAVTDRVLYCPRGNTAAMRYTRRGAVPLGTIWAATGGCFSLFFPGEDRVLAGGFAYQGKAALLDAPEGDPGGPDTVRYVLGAASAAFRDGVLYLQFPDRIQAVRRGSGESLWVTPVGAAHCVAAAADAVFVGGDDRVVALSPLDGGVIWEAPVDGRVHSVVVVEGAVCASTDRGELTCFMAGAAGDVAAAAPRPATPPTGGAPAAELRAGPVLRFLDASSAEISWSTARPSRTILAVGPVGNQRIIREEALRTEHRVVVTDLVQRRTVPYRIRTSGGDGELETAEFLCDTYLNYSVPPLPPAARDPGPGDPLVDRGVRHVLRTAAPGRGLCLVLGAGDEGAVAARIAAGSDARILIVDTSAERIEAVRRALGAGGAYGSRIAALLVDDMDHLPLPNHCFRLVVSSDTLTRGAVTCSGAEVERLLDPLRGVAVVGQPAGGSPAVSSAGLERWLASFDEPRPAGMPGVTVHLADGEEGTWATVRARGGLPGARPWTHQYADPGNTACSGDTLQGVTRFVETTTQWLGRPGARYQADRMVRKPAPLAAAGRLVLQGQGAVICVDTASGSVLWTLQLPGLGRVNVIRDASNWCTDGERVYLASGELCRVIDIDDGRVERTLDVRTPSGRADQEWGCVSTADGMLVGSWTTPGSAFTNTWGGGAWYEHNGWDKVCSSGLFGLDARSFEPRWTYERGVVVNATIAVGDGRIHFLETRVPGVVADRKRTLNGPALWAEPWLVAVDLKTGRTIWERHVADGGFPSADVMCGMVLSRGMLVFHGSTPATTAGGPKGFHHLRAFDAATGADAWACDEPWGGYGHGIQTSYPVVVGERLFQSPLVVNLGTGERLPGRWNEGHCGTTSASCHALFYRFTTIAFWDIEGRSETRWPSVRPDCWLSAIPAEGMLLAAEGGGGCVCGGWLETSAALAPRTDFAVFRTRRPCFINAMDVELEPPVGGGVLRVTTDGSEPARSSPRYEGPIRIAGTTTVRARVFGGPDARDGGPVVSRRFERLAAVRVPSAARVEFQPVAVGGGDADDTVDVGEPLRLDADGRGFGWTEDAFDGMWAVDAAVRTDPVRESLVWLRGGMCWEMAVENGDYDVAILVGNPTGETIRHDSGTILVGDEPLVLERDLARGEMVELTRRVAVGDGVLRLRKPADDRTSVGIAWLRFARAAAPDNPAR